MTPSFIYKVSFSLRKFIQISVCQNLAVQTVPNITLDRIYNGHAQKCRCLYNHSLTKIQAVTAKIILVSPASILVGE